MNSRKRARAELAWACVNIIHYFNYSVNFFLYCLSGSQFRNQLKLLVCGRLNRVAPNAFPVAVAHRPTSLPTHKPLCPRRSGTSTLNTIVTSSSCSPPRTSGDISLKSFLNHEPGTSHGFPCDPSMKNMFDDSPVTDHEPSRSQGVLEVTLKPPSVRWAPSRSSKVAPSGSHLQPREPTI